MQTVSLFSRPITHLLSMLCVLIKFLSHASAKKKTKRLKGSKFRSYLSFSSDITAVKGLRQQAEGRTGFDDVLGVDYFLLAPRKSSTDDNSCLTFF